MRRHSWTKALLGFIAAAGVCAVGLVAQGALGGLGVSETTGKGIVNGWLDSGYLNLTPAAKSFRAATPAGRASLAKNAVAWAKAYTESPAFKTWYDQRRKEDLPTPPEVKGSVDDELARQSAERKKSLEEMKKNVAQMAPEMRKAMEAAVKESEAANRKLETDPQMVAMMRQGIESERAANQERYQQRLASHERRFPANPNTVIARRLQEFLDISKTVDFDAKLVPAGKLMRFANPEYEEQKPLWKLCYRTGRDAVSAARESAQAWLKTL
jgi:Skp family chaperone for outer membrane proteins